VGGLAEDEEKCRRRLVSKSKDEPTGSMLPLPLQFLTAWLAVWLGQVLQRKVDYLLAENRVLREKLGGKVRLTDSGRRRLAVLGKKMGRRALAKVATIATPESISRWYRRLVAKKYDGSQRRGPGRPRKRGAIAELVLKMARENEWGYTRIKGAMQNLGYKVGRSTIQRILRENGIDPAPSRGMSWGTFVRAHLGVIAGMDFFMVEVVTLLGLLRYHVLFVIDIASRIVEVAGIGRDPGGRWMEQMARNLVDAEDGFLRGKRYVIIDRDPLHTERFRGILKGAGVKVVRLPSMSPNLNAYAERFVLSIKSECLERIVPLGERHLRRTISEFVAHYHHERNHQGLGNALIDGNEHDLAVVGRVVRREPLGGLLSYYHRKTAAPVRIEQWDRTGFHSREH
jgi:putative transposase